MHLFNISFTYFKVPNFKICLTFLFERTFKLQAEERRLRHGLHHAFTVTPKTFLKYIADPLGTFVGCLCFKLFMVTREEILLQVYTASYSCIYSYRLTDYEPCLITGSDIFFLIYWFMWLHLCTTVNKIHYWKQKIIYFPKELRLTA